MMSDAKYDVGNVLRLPLVLLALLHSLIIFSNSIGILQWLNSPFDLLGVRAEMVLGALERKLGKEAAGPSHEYLQQRLQYDAASERLMDADDRAVMMAWEGWGTVTRCPVLRNPACTRSVFFDSLAWT